MTNTNDNSLKVKNRTRLKIDALRSKVDYHQFEFETTEEVPVLTNVIGQERGTKVMKFGLNVNKIGYNLYVAGISGTGKTSFTETIVNEFAQKKTTLYDWCYVYNFENGSKPKVLQLPVGMGEKLKEDMEQLIENLKVDIPRAFNEEGYQKEKAAIIRDMKEQSTQVMEELNDVAKEHGFVIRQSGSGILTVPIIDGEPITEEQYRKLDEEKLKEINQKSTVVQEVMVDYQNRLRKLEKEAKETIENVEQKVALAAIGFHMYDLINKYENCEDVVTHLKSVQNDILKNINEFLQNDEKQEQNPLAMMMPKKPKGNFYIKYVVNLLVDNSNTEGAPVVIADNPNFYNLIGKVEYENQM